LLLDRSRAESDEAEVPAQLLVVTDSAATAQQREALIARARDEAPATAESLREAARARRAAGTTDEPAGLVVGSRAVGTDPFGAAPFAPPGGANAPTLTVDPFGQGAPRAADPFAAGGSVDRGALPIPHPRPGAHDERGVTPVDDPFSR
jgi:hypothetical protein